MRLNTKAHIALGQTSLLITLLLVAVTIGLIPDRQGAVISGRAALAEAVAANSSSSLSLDDARRLRGVLKLVVERNDDLLSAALRRNGGDVVVTVGDHIEQWQLDEGDLSSDSQVRVPIYAGEQRWGTVELRFMPLTRSGWQSLFDIEWLQLLVFVAVTGFVCFYLYLGRTLRHLDPNRAVPPHVRSALDTLAEGLLILDLKGNIVLANSAFAAVAGKPVDSLVGHSANKLPWIGDDGQAVAESDLPWYRTLTDAADERNAPIQLVDPQQRQLSFQVNCSPVLGAEGKHGGVLITFEDVTELEENKQALFKSKEEADSANRAKSDFLANMSHEIRTPMNAILGFTEVLRRGVAKSESERKKHLNTIHTSGKHLLQLINDVLDLSKVEAGRLDVEKIDVPAHTLVREVVNVLAVKAEEKQIALDFEIVGQVPAHIQSDPTRLRQIITNLVGNAIKFTDRGGVRVVFQMASTAEAHRIVVDIIDTGLGMPEDKLEGIFEAFVQADSSVTRQFGGTGLGLAISRKFARALGGDIVVRSEVGKGSVFTVLIDPGDISGVEMVDGTEVFTEEVSAPGAGQRWRFAPAKVLVVDDGEENRELIQVVLSDVGLEVDGAENGRIGADMAMGGDYEVVLMDMQMPVMDGREATRWLRDQGYSKPIIALTANAMKGYEKECEEIGCSAYLTKPVDVDGLIKTLSNYLAGQYDESSSAQVSDEQSVEESTEQIIKAPTERLESNVDEDIDPRLLRIRNQFIERLGDRVSVLDSAWSARDMGELASFGHWLKGSAGTLGLGQFVEPAANLEAAAKSADEAAVEVIVDSLRKQISGVSGRPESPSPQAKVTADTAPQSTQSSRAVAPVKDLVGARKDPRLVRIQKVFASRLDHQMVAIELAWNARDYAELATLAHWLKGSAGTVGFSQFTEPAAKLENQAKEKMPAGLEELVKTLRAMTDEILPPPSKVASLVAKPAIVERKETAPRTPTGRQHSITQNAAVDPRLVRIRTNFVGRLVEKMAFANQQWAERDYQELAGFAHWLKGSAGTVGFKEFTEPAERLEGYAKAGDEAKVEASLKSIQLLTDGLMVGTEKEAV